MKLGFRMQRWVGLGFLQWKVCKENLWVAVTCSGCPSSLARFGASPVLTKSFYSSLQTEMKEPNKLQCELIWPLQMQTEFWKNTPDFCLTVLTPLLSFLIHVGIWYFTWPFDKCYYAQLEVYHPEYASNKHFLGAIFSFLRAILCPLLYRTYHPDKPHKPLFSTRGSVQDAIRERVKPCSWDSSAFCNCSLRVHTNVLQNCLELWLCLKFLLLIYNFVKLCPRGTMEPEVT